MRPHWHNSYDNDPEDGMCLKCHHKEDEEEYLEASGA
jgi:nitrate reductase cytochrome c-type subunit